MHGPPFPPYESAQQWGLPRESKPLHRCLPDAVQHDASLDIAPCTPSKTGAASLPVLLYARREKEEFFQPLHLVPPSLAGLAKAIESKYKVEASSIKNIFKRCKKGVTVRMDDDVVKHYCNEDTFLIEMEPNGVDAFDVTLIEL